MKKITLCALFLSSFFAGAQTITLSHSQTIEPANTVSCSDPETGAAVADNFYFRFFDLGDFDITEDYDISTVEFGIQSLTNLVDGTYPITVKLYATTDTEANFPANYAELTNMMLLATETYVVPDQELTIYEGAIEATVPAGSDLIVEISYEADDTLQTAVTLGSNNDGQDGPTYIMSPGEGCDLNESTPTAGINFPDVHLVLNVVGTGGTAGMNDNSLSALAVYPNPTTGIINIQNAEGIKKASLTDVSGKVFNVTVVSNAIDMSTLASGVYFLTLQTETGTTTRKIVKE